MHLTLSPLDRFARSRQQLSISLQRCRRRFFFSTPLQWECHFFTKTSRTAGTVPVFEPSKLRLWLQRRAFWAQTGAVAAVWCPIFWAPTWPLLEAQHGAKNDENSTRTSIAPKNNLRTATRGVFGVVWTVPGRQLGLQDDQHGAQDGQLGGQDGPTWRPKPVPSVSQRVPRAPRHDLKRSKTAKND